MVGILHLPITNKNFIFIFCVFVICCSFKEIDYCNLSDKIFIPYNTELCKKRNLFLVGSGGAMMDDIQKVNASYFSFEKMTVEDARKLYVDIAEGYISRYNKNEQIRPYLHNYPFTIDNFHILIGFLDPSRTQSRHRGDGFVAMVVNSKKNRIFYCAYDHEKKKFVDLYEEPYETARAIVLSEKKQTRINLHE
jgi:hypothetical protein